MNTITRTLKRVRSIVLLFIVMLSTYSVKATSFFTDVMSLGGNKSETATFGDVYKKLEWNFIDYDLNKGVEGDYVYLLYRTSSNESDINNNYIRDFYLYRVASQNTPYSFKDSNGRTWYLAPFDGGNHFRGQLGDFNSGTGESTDPIHLYYTRDPLPGDNRAVTQVWFDSEKSGAVGKNGGSEGYDLNEGCGRKATKIYMHVRKENVNSPHLASLVDVDKVSGGKGQINIKGSAYDPDVPTVTIKVKVSIHKVGSSDPEPYREITITPDLTDPSYNREKKVSGPHSFDTSIPCIEEGQYTVILRPIDHTGDNITLGYQTTVYVEPKPFVTINNLEPSNMDDFIGRQTDVILKGHPLYWDGQYHSLCLPFDLDDLKGTPLEYASIVTLYGSDFHDETLTLYTGPGQTSIKAGTPYLVGYPLLDYELIIKTVDDWNEFAASVAAGNTYEGKTVILANDIGRGYEPVKTMVGTEEHPFRGTFIGNYNVITVNIDGFEHGAAPFRYIEGATINSLYVFGTIKGANMTAGIVGYAKGGDNHIERCVSRAELMTIKTYTGGLLGCCRSGATVTIEDCIGSCSALLGINHATGLLCGYAEEGSVVNINRCYAEGNIITWSNPNDVKIDLLYGNGNINVSNTYKYWNYGKYGTYMEFDGNEERIKTLLGDNFGADSNGKPAMFIHTIINLNKVFDVIPDPIFENVTIKKTSYNDPENWVISDYAFFIGSTTPVNISKVANSLYVGDDGIDARRNMSACHSFFIYRNIPQGSTVKNFNVVLGHPELYDEIVKAPVIPVKEDKVSVKVDGWYTIDGRKLESAPTTKGLYIYNGRSVMIR